MSLTTGSRLGPYEILGALGAGGMGEVYKARDTRLGRTVAIKVLAALGQADPESRARFEREAKVLASFDHPHICALHDVGREGGVDFIVMPYVAGETLAARLDKGRMPLPQVVEVAMQIADALDRAHAHGIVHRDLKPGNIMLTKSGARLLDFGLARLEEPASASAEETATRIALTQVGTVMGTVPYMSPEQLHGTAVDSRTDIWAFGCVLYEMLAGRTPFAGDSHPAVMGAILRSEPEPLSTIRPDLPAGFGEVISGTLVKDPDERWQHMRDVRRALVIASQTSGTTFPPVAPVPKSGRRGIAAAFVAVMLFSILGFAWAAWQRPANSPLTRFDLNAVGLGTITTFTDVRPYFAASPDGQRIAFVATVNGSTDIWIKRLDGDKPELLADTGNASSPFWSADSHSVGFYADGGLKRKSLSGGPAVKLCDTDAQGINGTWSANDVILFSDWGTRKIMQVSASGGTPVMVREGKNPLTWVHFLPDGRHFLHNLYDLESNTRKLFVGSLDSPDDVLVTGVFGRAEFAEGHLVFWLEGGLVAQPFDLKTSQIKGQPVPMADDVHAFESTGFAAFSTSPGLLVYQAGPIEERLVWLDRQGLQLAMIGPPKDYVDVRLSPDGRALAMAARDRRLGTSDIFVTELDRELTRPLTTDRGTENGPVWSPDSRSIVFAAGRRGPPNLHIRSADGTGGEREVVAPALGPHAAGSFTPDGQSLVFLEPHPGTNYDIMVAPIDRSGLPVPVVATKGRETSPRISPDGRWLAYASTESGRPEIYVQSWPDGRGRRQVSREGGTNVRWRGDSKELFFVTGPAADHLMAASIGTNGDAIESGAPRLLFVARGDLNGYDVARDGQKFLVISPDRAAERGTLSVVANWAGLLRK